MHRRPLRPPLQVHVFVLVLNTQTSGLHSLSAPHTAASKQQSSECLAWPFCRVSIIISQYLKYMLYTLHNCCRIRTPHLPAIHTDGDEGVAIIVFIAADLHLFLQRAGRLHQKLDGPKIRTWAAVACGCASNGPSIKGIRQ